MNILLDEEADADATCAGWTALVVLQNVAANS
jgi:hypothetical protein